MLGMNPQNIRQEFRLLTHAYGKEMGHSPQEAAILLASKLPPEWRVTLNPGKVREWIRKNKVNPRDHNISVALADLGWEDFVT